MLFYLYLIVEALPLCPENIKINQTKNGILIAWSYPKQTPVKIEYFQIYFREILNDKPLKNYSSSTASSSLSEWKTSESIQASQSEYFVDDANLSENKLYEFQLVSFSTYSKSLPSHTIKLKYAAKTTTSKPQYLNNNFKPSMFTTSSSTSPLFLRLVNISQLDIILIAIFVILLFIMILCIVACIAYKRSSKSFKNKQSSKKIKGTCVVFLNLERTC